MGEDERGSNRQLVYVAEPADIQVSVRRGAESVPLCRDGRPVAWPAGPGMEPVAAAVMAHLTGIARPRPPLPDRLAEEVLVDRWQDGGLHVPAVTVRDWLAEHAPGLVHDELPGLEGAGAPPEPPGTLEALLDQPGRDAVRRISVAQGIYANHPWHADWLPATGEVLSVMHTGADPAEWAVARVLPNVAVADVLCLTADPPRGLSQLLERLDQLAGSGADGPAAWEDAS